MPRCLLGLPPHSLPFAVAGATCTYTVPDVGVGLVVRMVGGTVGQGAALRHDAQSALPPVLGLVGQSQVGGFDAPAVGAVLSGVTGGVPVVALVVDSLDAAGQEGASDHIAHHQPVHVGVLAVEPYRPIAPVVAADSDQQASVGGPLGGLVQKEERFMSVHMPSLVGGESDS